MGKEIVYSSQRSGFERGRTYENPRFFEKPHDDADKVIVVGDWPKVVAAYEALKIEVVKVDNPNAVKFVRNYEVRKKQREELQETGDDNKGDQTENRLVPIELPKNPRKLTGPEAVKIARALGFDVTTRREALKVIYDAKAAAGELPPQE